MVPRVAASSTFSFDQITAYTLPGREDGKESSPALAGKGVHGESRACSTLEARSRTLERVKKRVILVPMERLDGAFFHLQTRLAGQIVQKFVTYQRRLVILGDFSGYTVSSRAFRDFMTEANRGTQLWFLTNLQELGKRLQKGKRGPS